MKDARATATRPPGEERAEPARPLLPRRALPAPLEARVRQALADWDAREGSRRLFAGDATLWTGGDEASWLGWLDAPERARGDLPVYEEAATWGRRFEEALLLGMGGSSLAPEVWRETFGPRAGHPQLSVLDSTDPAQVRALGDRVDPRRAAFVVASKSGSTLEPQLFEAHFFARARAALGDAAGEHFVAITDPGSALERLAGEQRYHRVYSGVPSIGGRYSALSSFGLVPAAIAGLDVARLIEAAAGMRAACLPDRAAEDNPGVSLGATMGALAGAGVDKLTLVASPGIASFGAWLEQLIAESTGKQGRGIVPVDGERLAAPERYGEDRLFAYLRLESEPDAEQDAAVGALERAGCAVLGIDVPDRTALAAEMYRWEIATAVAGSLLGIHPFDQPDVEASKVATRALTEEYERTGRLAPESPFLEDDGVRLFADERNAADLRARTGADRTLAGALRAHLDRLATGDYFALLAYLPMTPAVASPLQTVRHRVRDQRRVATCLGFGPRFLHSTGQLYKGGSNRGVFLQVTADDARDLPVPGRRVTFGAVKAAQARGDFAVLAERERRALRVHLGADLDRGLRALDAAVAAALTR
jgi:transaldolase/glucose-6-phosphate isomerase